MLLSMVLELLRQSIRVSALPDVHERELRDCLAQLGEARELAGGELRHHQLEIGAIALSVTQPPCQCGHCGAVTAVCWKYVPQRLLDVLLREWTRQ